MSEQEQLQRKCAFCDAQLFMLDGEGQNRRMFGVHDERACEIAALQSKLEAWERSAQEGHPNPCTLGPLCPYCEIERLSSKLHEREKLLREIDAFMSFRPVVPAEQTKKIQQSIREALSNE